MLFMKVRTWFKGKDLFGKRRVQKKLFHSKQVCKTDNLNQISANQVQFLLTYRAQLPGSSLEQDKYSCSPFHTKIFYHVGIRQYNWTKSNILFDSSKPKPHKIFTTVQGNWNSSLTCKRVLLGGGFEYNWVISNMLFVTVRQNYGRFIVLREICQSYVLCRE